MEDSNPLLSAEQEKFLTALEDSLGIVSKAAEQCGIHRSCHWRWLSGQNLADFAEEYKRRVKEIDETTKDVIEDALYNEVKNGNIMAIMYAANNRLKTRGFGRTDDMPQGDGITIKQFVLNVKTDSLVLPPHIPILLNGQNGNGKH